MRQAWLLATDLPAPAQSVSPGGSPYTYTAAAAGKLIVSGGTVSLIEMGRRGSFYTTGETAGVFPLSVGDALRITYSSAPTLTMMVN